MMDDILVAAKEKMLQEDLYKRGITTESILKAMRYVDREKFVPHSVREKAYDDSPLPIGDGQTISQPYIVALAAELLQLSADDNLLEIGAGSGYQAAVFSYLVKNVHSIEINPDLARKAAALLKQLGFNNISVINQDGFYGYLDKAPFNKIISAASVRKIPKLIEAQLAEDGLILFPVGGYDIQNFMLGHKVDNTIEYKKVVAVKFVRMRGKIETS